MNRSDNIITRLIDKVNSNTNEIIGIKRALSIKNVESKSSDIAGQQGGYASITNHSELLGLDASNSHPLSAITGLSDFKDLFDSMFEKVTSGNDWYIKAKKDFCSIGATSITASGSISTNEGFHQAIDTCLYCNNNPWMWPRHSDGWMYTNTDTNGWRIRNKSSNFLMTIMGGGNVGIGTPTPSEKLEIKGGKLKLTSADGTKSVTLELDNSGNLKINGNVFATGAVTAYQTN